MADLGMDFHVDDVPPDEFEKLPVGRYLAQITESDVRDNSKDTGRLAELVWTVMDGPLEGRMFWDLINYKHQNPEAERIGQQKLAKVCKACGKEGAGNTEDLHFIPVWITVVDRMNKKTGVPDRVIQSYEQANLGAPQRPQQPAPRQGSGAAAPRGNGGGAAAGRSGQAQGGGQAAPSGGGARTWRQRQPAQTHPVDDDVPF